ncbi:MAG: NAD(P)H-hydrate epimerase, partial [Verrucomicrobiota bacterium]
MLTPREMQDLERRAFAAGADAESLMEEVARGMADAVSQFCPVPGVCLAFFGKGHNGGDALATARLLSQRGWQVLLVPAFPRGDWAPLTLKKWEQAGRCETISSAEAEQWRPPPARSCVLLDGLLGIGAVGSLKDPVAAACRQINWLRNNSAAKVFALDIPTGLDGASGHADVDTVVADVTLSVGFAKQGLVADGAEHFVGRLAVIPVRAFDSAAQTRDTLECATPASLAPLWRRRPAEMHKGNCGRVTLVAGNVGTVGAAILSAKGALRAGAGLVTLCVPEEIYPVAAALAPLECMVRPLCSLEEVLSIRSDALGIGPGLGRKNAEAVLGLIG